MVDRNGLGETTWTKEISNEPWENAETGEISGRNTAIAEERGSTSTMYLAPGSFAVAEWNGHKHEPIPDTDRWVYLVQHVGQ
jgi:hypothetical protein